MKLRALIAVGTACLLLLGTACGGDKDSSGSGAVGAPLDLSASANNLLEMRSFRFDFAMKLELPSSPPSSSADEDDFGAAFGALLLGLFSDIKAEGAFVAPDQTEVRLTLMGEELGFVQIGKDAWVKTGPRWEKTTAEDSLSMGLGSPTELFSEFLPQEVLRGAKTSKEKVNGVDTTHYSFDKKALEKLALESGEPTVGLEELTDAHLDVWISEDSVPVKVSLNAIGKDESGQNVGLKLEMNIRDLNSDSIKIKAPI